MVRGDGSVGEQRTDLLEAQSPLAQRQRPIQPGHVCAVVAAVPGSGTARTDQPDLIPVPQRPHRKTRGARQLAHAPLSVSSTVDTRHNTDARISHRVRCKLQKASAGMVRRASLRPVTVAL